MSYDANSSIEMEHPLQKLLWDMNTKLMEQFIVNEMLAMQRFSLTGNETPWVVGDTGLEPVTSAM